MEAIHSLVENNYVPYWGREREERRRNIDDKVNQWV